MSDQLTQEQADKLVAARKTVSSSVSWRPVFGTFRLEVKALSLNPRAAFSLRGYIGRTNHSFTLLYNNIPIRRYTKHQVHRIGKKVFKEPHKHFWDEVNQGNDAYIPNDIDPGANINEQFLAFCNECNIKLVGGYQNVMYVVR